VSNNSLTGDVFQSFATLNSSINVTILDFSSNNLTGTIPASFDATKLANLRVLLLPNNKLQGSIPPWIWRLPKLQLLELKNNRFAGPISGNFSELNGYINMTVSDTDQLVTSEGSTDTYLPSLSIDVSGSRVTYSSAIKFVVSMSLAQNLLTGAIPEEMTKLVKLKFLNLSWNTFDGEIPADIGSLAALESLDVSHNRLSGPIPASVTNLTKLSELRVAGNDLSGPIPQRGQLLSFTNDSFWHPGNPGLCGPPLDTSRYPCNPSPGTSFTDLFTVPGFIIGFVAGFFVIAVVFSLWKPARHFVRVPEDETKTGAWRPPRRAL